MGTLVITFATLKEAKATIEHLDAQPQSSHTYVFAQGLIVITGMGLLSTLSCLYEIETPISEIWNFGCAGSVHGDQELFSLHEISSIHRYYPHQSAHSQALFEKMYPPILLQDKGEALLCTEASINHEIQTKCSLVDMESYAVSWFAQKKNVPCTMIKCVSDFANHSTPEDIQKNLSRISSLLQDQVKVMLADSCV